MVKPFVMDGIEYNVWVEELERSFSVLDTDKTGRTQDGNMYRDPIGTYYNYSMTVSDRDGDFQALDAFWDAISLPQESHVCEFPYNQETLTQRMYVTSGKQAIRQIHSNHTKWGSIKINFIAMSPEVVP